MSHFLFDKGSGSIAKSPDRPFYSVGEQVALTAMPGRWYAFNQWSDGPTTNPRVIVYEVTTHAIFGTLLGRAIRRDDQFADGSHGPLQSSIRAT